MTQYTLAKALYDQMEKHGIEQRRGQEFDRAMIPIVAIAGCSSSGPFRDGFHKHLTSIDKKAVLPTMVFEPEYRMYGHVTTPEATPLRSFFFDTL